MEATAWAARASSLASSRSVILAPIGIKLALRWTTVAPIVAALVLAATWGTKPATPVLVVVGVLLAGAVLAAVHHAEVVAHRVGEPFGSLISRSP
jgi:Ca2+/H+ antiporter